MRKTFHILLLLLLPMAVLLSCTDDESFTDSRGKTLSFSMDTVKMDTVFSKVPTPAKNFWVYNRSGDGIRCTQVKLQNGNQTGYRVNVDGTYLSASTGYQVQNVEIRNKDSLRVFVELTSPETGANEPKLVEDNLVFVLESGVEQKVNLNAYSWDATVMRNVVIKENTTLESSSPVIVYGPLVVERGVTLTIPAGQTLYFHGDAGVDVYGRLVTEGTADAPVVLRGDRLDNMFDYLPYDMVSGQWQGVKFHESSYYNQMSYTDLHSSFDGIVCDSADVSKQKLTISNSTVHNCQGTCMQIINSKVTLTNCQLTNALGNCLDIMGGNVSMNHCTLAQFYPFDSARGAALQFACKEGSPLLKMDCINSIVTGYADDEMMGTPADSIDFNYWFENTVIRTPEVDDSLHFRNMYWENVEDTVNVGDKHFKLVDLHNQHYDFHLSEVSAAIGKALKEKSLPVDHDGRSRDEEPDAGAYEFYKEEQTN